MPWQSLTTTLNTKPRVLAGPLLRKVTPNSVTVWLALRMPGKVTLKVLDASGNRVMEGHRLAVAIGTNLHIVAVTACPLCGAQMRIIALLTQAPAVTTILRHLGEPTSPPEVAPARAPPLWDQAPEPAPDRDDSPAPLPQFVFDQRLGW